MRRDGGATPSMPASVVIAIVAMAGAGCAVPPWSMGAPLNGTPSIPPTTEAPSVARLRAQANLARAAGHVALELRALRAIDAADRLTQDERARLAPLLEQRAAELLMARRPVPACADLRALAALAPAHARALATIHAVAERDAGDAWLAVGDRKQARDSYLAASALGAAGVDIRLAATDEDAAAPARLSDAAVARAVLDLPLRAVPPFAALYLARPPQELNRAAVARALLAARQEKREALAARLRQLLAQIPAPPPEQTSDALLDAPAAPAPPAASLTSDPRAEAASLDAGSLDQWVLGAAAFASRLLPLLQRNPALLAPGPRSRAWGQLLLDEDPTSPAVLEVTAVIEGLADRVGGAQQRLTDLVYFSPDRYQGMIRAAAVWRRVGQPRLACVTWLRAARWQDDVDDPAWRQAIDCTRRDPGAGDWRAVLRYVLDRAPADRRTALAAMLDPALAPASAPATYRRAGDPIPCDTGGNP